MNKHISITLNIDPTDFPQSKTHLVLKHRDDNWVLNGKYGLYNENVVDTVVSNDVVNRAMSRLSGHKVPVIPASFITGCDGSTTTLKFKTDKDSHAFSWWYGDGYEVLDTFAEKMLEWENVRIRF